MSNRWKLWSAAIVGLSAAVATMVPAADPPQADPFYEGFYGAHLRYLNQAHLSVGLLGDAVAKKVYEGSPATELATLHARWAAAAGSELTKVSKSDESDEEDAKLMLKMARLAGLVQAQSDAVAGLAAGDDAQAAEFGKHRDAAVKLLDELNAEVPQFLK